MSGLDIDNACSLSANEPVGTTTLEAAACNLGHLDRIATSQDTTSVNRRGRADLTIAGLNAQAQAVFAAAGGVLLGDGVYGVGIEYTNRNQYLIDAGIPYKVRSTVTLPYTTTTATAIADANLQPFNEVSNSDLTTLLEQTLGAGSSLYIGSDNGISAVVAENDNVPAGTTHLRVSVNGNPEIVAISPVSAGGAVTLLTESGCEIGGQRTIFRVQTIPDDTPSASLHHDYKNLNTTALNVGWDKNKATANQDNWTLLFGDSHGWGQGAPEWDLFSGRLNSSIHSAFPHNKGFMWRIEENIRERKQFSENSYSLAHLRILGRVTGADSRSDVNTDITCTYPLHLESGRLDSSERVLVDSTTNTFTEMYSPKARQAGYADITYREKLSKGLFGRSLMTLKLEGLNEFTSEGKDYGMEIIPNPSYSGSGGSFTALTFGTPSLVVGEFSTANVFFLITSIQSFPQWFMSSDGFYVPGYGVVKVVSILNNGAVQLRNEDDTEIGNSLNGFIYPGVKVYPAAYRNKATLRCEMVAPARAIYVSVRHHSNGGNLRVSFSDSVSGGAALRQNINPQVTSDNSANEWAPIFNTNLARVNLVRTGQLWDTPTKATADARGVIIDTSQITTGVNEEVVYRIDLGSKQLGVIYLEMTENSAGNTVETRGIVLDNNKVVNCSMGAHTVASWIGSQSSNANETRDHVADILSFTPIQPSNVIVQLPLVNEYIKQNSTTSFLGALQSFTARFESHFNSSDNYNSQGVNFLFFTSIRQRDVAFEGLAEDSVTYNDYIETAKSFCDDNNHAFVDCEAELFRLVGSGRVNYERLYSDNLHPSDYSNEVIYRVLSEDYLQFMV